MPNIKVGNDWTPSNRLAVPAAVIKKYPGRHFVWANVNDNALSKKEGDGYEYPTITAEEMPKGRPSTKAKINTDSADATIRRGDAILMMIPEETYKARMVYYEKLTDSKFPERRKNTADAIKRIDSRIVVEEKMEQDK